MLRHTNVVVCLALFFTPAAAIAQPRAEPPRKAPAPLFPEDEKLARPVTMARGGVYLGELVGILSRESGIRLRVDDAKGPVGGIHLLVFLKERPLRDVMSGLQELFAHRFDRWEWQREPGGRTGYVLRHQRSPEEATAAARAAILSRFTQDTRDLHRIARLPDAERTAQSASRSDLFPRGSMDRGRLDLFGRLSNVEMDALLKGAFVSPGGPAFSERETGALTLGISGGGTFTSFGTAPPSAPRPPGFNIGWDRDQLGPILWLRNGGGGTNVIGGGWWDSNWLAREGEGWKDRWSPGVEEFVQRLIFGKAGADARPLPAVTLGEWLRLASDQQQMSVMVDLVYPRTMSRWPQAWLGRTPDHTAMALIQGIGLTWKEHGGVHLLRHQGAVVNPRSHLIPWSQVRSLREAAGREAGYFDLPELLELAGLSADQLAGIMREFPAAEPEALARWRPILQFCRNLTPASLRKLTSDEGLPFRNAGLVARAYLLDAPPLPPSVEVRGLDLLARDGARATVSLRMQATRAPVIDRSGSKMQEIRRLTWEVRVPETPPYRRTWDLQPRRAPKPDGEIP